MVSLFYLLLKFSYFNSQAMNSDFDKDVDNPDNYKFTIFYYNINDRRVIVPKRNRWLGWTLNFGQVNTYLLIASIIIIIVVSKIYL